MTRDGEPVPVEKQVFDLLALLIEARDRVVTKDEMVEAIWGGRAISDAAITTRIRSARRAIGDDGRAQSSIATLHRVGYRFVAEVRSNEVVAPPTRPGTAALNSARASIAVLPFERIGEGHPSFPLSDAIAHDLISELSRFRWLFVIGRGSTFQLRGSAASPTEVRDRLGARYSVTGTVEATGEQVTVSVELAATQDGTVIVAERMTRPLAEVYALRNDILSRVLRALEYELSLFEAHHARLTDPGSLDGWAKHHLAIDHLFRFRRADTIRAVELFREAIALEPTFARSYAGLSTALWQEAFMGYGPDANRAAEEARDAADRALELDPYDPLANTAKGRTFFLSGELERSLPWLDRAISQMPNYAPAHYARGWALVLLGEPDAAERSVEMAERLSPLDPLRYAFLTTLGLCQFVRGAHGKAAELAERGASEPGAHALVAAIAAAMHELAGNRDQALTWARAVGKDVNIKDPALLLRSYPFRDGAHLQTLSGALGRVGL